MLYEFLIAYSVLLGLSAMCRSRQMLRVSLAMLGNWAVNSAFVASTGDFAPWLWFACIDFITALVILRNPAGKWQSAIGWVYIAQIVMHFCFAATNNPDGIYPYWLWLTRLAWVQIILVAAWGIGGGLRAGIHRLFGRPHHPVPHGMAGMEP